MPFQASFAGVDRRDPTRVVPARGEKGPDRHARTLPAPYLERRRHRAMSKRLATHSWEVRQALAAREPFTTYGSFRSVLRAPWDTGRLPDPYRSRYLDARSDDRITYTVLSYRTPVAWTLDDGTVVIPPVKYSPTTTGHQALLYALGRPANAFASEVSREHEAARTGARELAWIPTRPPASWDWDRAGDVNSAAQSREVPFESGEGAICSPEYLVSPREHQGHRPDAMATAGGAVTADRAIVPSPVAGATPRSARSVGL